MQRIDQQDGSTIFTTPLYSVRIPAPKPPAPVVTAEEQRKIEARRIIAVQAATLPKPRDDGKIDIGPMGAWERAGNVQVEGRYVHECMPEPEHRGLPRR